MDTLRSFLWTVAALLAAAVIWSWWRGRQRPPGAPGTGASAGRGWVDVPAGARAPEQGPLAGDSAPSAGAGSSPGGSSPGGVFWSCG